MGGEPRKGQRNEHRVGRGRIWRGYDVNISLIIIIFYGMMYRDSTHVRQCDKPSAQILIGLFKISMRWLLLSSAFDGAENSKMLSNLPCKSEGDRNHTEIHHILKLVTLPLSWPRTLRQALQTFLVTCFKSGVFYLPWDNFIHFDTYIFIYFISFQ